MKSIKTGLAVLMVVVLAVSAVSMGAVVAQQEQNGQQEKEPNDGIENATSIEVGESVTANIDTVDDIDSYMFTLEAEQPLRVTLSASENLTVRNTSAAESQDTPRFTFAQFQRNGTGIFGVGPPFTLVAAGESYSYTIHPDSGREEIGCEATGTESESEATCPPGEFVIRVLPSNPDVAVQQDSTVGSYTISIEPVNAMNGSQTETPTTTETPTATPTPTETQTPTETTTLTQTATPTEEEMGADETPAPTEAEQTTGNLTAAEIVQNARQSYDDIHNFNATVVSTTSVSNGTGAMGDIKIKAKLSFERPDNIRFEFLAPANQSGNVVISNGTTTVFYNAANNTYRTFSFNGSVLGGRAMNLSQTGYLDSIERTLAQSNVTYLGTATVAGQETYKLSVEPTGLAANFTDNVTFYLDQETYLPVKRVVHASLSFGNQTTSFTTTTILRDVRVNVSIPEKVFDFNPPEDAERVEGVLSNVSTTSYDTIEQARQNTDIRICEPSQIPAGYSFDNATVSSLGNTTSVTLRYTNGSGGAFSVSIAEAMADQQSNQSGIGETISVDGQSGIYIEVRGQGIVTFSDDGLQYTVTGPFSQDTLVSIAGSIDCADDSDSGTDAGDEGVTEDGDAGDEETPEENELGENDEDDDGDGAIDEDDEDNEGPSNDDDDGDGAIDEDDEPDDGDDGSDNFNGQAEDDDDGDGAIDEDDEPDSGNSDDVDNDGDGAVDEDDEPDTDD
jgi:outer membrane lipoprotein-sorting protein